MFLENMFGNLFGLIWIIIFILGVAALIVWLFIKKDNRVEEKEVIETSDSVDVVEDIKQEDVIEEKEISNVYEIVEQDGFFKVRKKGSERTIRKFSTELEAINYVKGKE